MNSPKEFSSSDPDNVLLEMDIAFEEACISLKEAHIQNPKDLSVFEWESVVSVFKKRRAKQSVSQ